MKISSKVVIVVNYILGSDPKIYTKLFLLNISGYSLSSKQMTNTTTASIKSKINLLEIYHLGSGTTNFEFRKTATSF